METSDAANEFESVKRRLEEIAQAVADENMPLDEALDLYEEAVALGLKASDLLEVGIVVEDPDPNLGPNPTPGPDPNQDLRVD